MSKKSFHLRWNNHLQNLQTLFENLFIEQSLIDVTISCSDGALYAHKLVLSACSPYFEQILKDNPCEHPVMILKGIKRQDMALLLEYMYKGAVDVAEEDLDNMLDTATELQIKGLIQDTPKSNQQRPATVKQERFDQEDAEHRVADDCPTGLAEDDMRWQAQLVAQPSRPHANLKSEEIMQPEDSIRNSMDTQTHHKSPEPQEMNDSQNEASSSTNFPLKHVLREDEEDSTGNEEDNNDYSQMEDSSQNISLENIFPANGIMSDAIEFNWVCHICQRKFQNKNSYQRHMLTHAGVKPNHCTVCGKSFLRLSHLQRHIRVHTGERPYSCSQCHKQFARSDKLRQHFIIQHNTPAGTIPRGRGRPRKNIAAYGASGDLQILQSADNPYPVTINPVSMAPSLPYHPSISMSAT